MLELTNYNKYLNRATEATKILTLRTALGNAVLFGIIFGFYAYSFFWGGYLRYENVINRDNKTYSGGAIIGCMFCVVFSSF